MAIADLKQHSPEQGKIYLIDTNVWQFILAAPTDLKEYEKVYFNFFDALINLASNNLCKQKPSIYINALIISEIYNAFIKRHHQSFLEKEGKYIDIKKYRQTDDYRKKQSIIKSDLQAYRPYFLIDNDLVFDPVEVLMNLPGDVDYNDNFYYLIANQRNMIVVTNDQDFKYHDLHVLTNNGKLMSSAKSSDVK